MRKTAVAKIRAMDWGSQEWCFMFYVSCFTRALTLINEPDITSFAWVFHDKFHFSFKFDYFAAFLLFYTEH